jgi:hypothetical protein
MDADRRRRIARDLLDAIDTIPIGPDGPGDFDLDDLVATTKLEAELVGRLTDEMERGRAVAKALDAALVLLDGGGWRQVTLTELRGADAEEFHRLFADQTVTDK